MGKQAQSKLYVVGIIVDASVESVCVLEEIFTWLRNVREIKKVVLYGNFQSEQTAVVTKKLLNYLANTPPTFEVEFVYGDARKKFVSELQNALLTMGDNVDPHKFAKKFMVNQETLSPIDLLFVRGEMVDGSSRTFLNGEVIADTFYAEFGLYSEFSLTSFRG